MKEELEKRLESKLEKRLELISSKSATLSKASTLAETADRLLDLHEKMSCQGDKDLVLVLAATLCMEAKKILEDI